MLNNNITIGVVVITYNGQKYIKEQLDSILNQTLAPDKVLIFDDKSNDDTVDIIKKYISNNNLKCELHINSKNVAWCKNVYNSLKK